MRRFFFDPEQETNGRIKITGSEALHISTVLRMQPGTEVELYDGRGGTIHGKILQITSREVIISILTRRTEHDSGTPLTLVQALLKGKKMDFLIQKATELGVHTFRPLSTRYCEKRVHNARQEERWQRIMLEACKQCRRPTPMLIKEPILLEQLQPADNCNLIMPWEDEDSCPLSPVLLNRKQPTFLLIGPEGGFHPTEVTLARSLGFHTVSLGPRILRAETAALAATAIVQHLSHNLSPEQQDLNTI